jgi:hypothetical protein
MDLDPQHPNLEEEMLRRKLPQSRMGVRKKVGVYLDANEQAQLESLARKRSTSSSALIAGFIREAMERESSQATPNSNPIESLLLAAMSRLTKLERIQRTLVLNTASARGYAIAMLRTAPSDSLKIIEQEMSRNFKEQRDFFFELYPDQRESDGNERGKP